jgi:hypothetical protein
VPDVISDAAAETVVEPVPADVLVRQLIERVRAEGLRLTGEGGLLSRLTKMVVKPALEGEMEDQLGYARRGPADRGGGNSRNGTRSKELLTKAGPVQIAVPRDLDGSFTPQLVRRRQRRLSGVDDLDISLSDQGLTHGEICAHPTEVYGAEVSTQTISTITEKVLEGLAAWQSRPLDPGLSGDLHRRGEREDPRRAGREPAATRRSSGSGPTPGPNSCPCSSTGKSAPSSARPMPLRAPTRASERRGHPRTLPHRAGCAQMRLSGGHES